MPEFVSAEFRGDCGEAVKVSVQHGRALVEVTDDPSGTLADVYLDRAGALALSNALARAAAELSPGPNEVVITMQPTGYYETTGPVRHVRLGGNASLSQSVHDVREVR